MVLSVMTSFLVKWMKWWRWCSDVMRDGAFILEVLFLSLMKSCISCVVVS